MARKRETVPWRSEGPRSPETQTGTGFGSGKAVGPGPGPSEEGKGERPRSSGRYSVTGSVMMPRDRAMQALRLTLFAMIAAGAVAFVMRTRLPEVTAFGTGKIVHGVTSSAGTAKTSQAETQAQDALYGYYILSRLARTRAEAQEITTLRSMATNPRLSAKARVQAAANLDLVARWQREETEIETLLASQGFPESVVVISNSRAMVVVPEKGLNVGKVARIGTDVWNLANIPPQEVLVEPHA